MSKIKSPLLSLGAKGTIADALTFQKHASGTIARQKPIPADPYSLAQAYQRWDYRDYAYLWTLQTNSEKQVYRTRASRYHITGFSLWMREKLKTLPNLALRLHLDESSGAVAYDSSKNLNHGTIVGPSPTPGRIDYCRSFDGLNDYIEVINDPSLGPPKITVELWAKVTSTHPTQPPYIVSNLKWSAPRYQGYSIWQSTGGYTIYAQTGTSVGLFNIEIGAAPNEWAHYAFTSDGSNIKTYLHGDEKVVTPAGDILQAIDNLRIGKSPITNAFYTGLIDELKIYNRALDATEIKRHSERRYPV